MNWSSQLWISLSSYRKGGGEVNNNSDLSSRIDSGTCSFFGKASDSTVSLSLPRRVNCYQWFLLASLSGGILSSGNLELTKTNMNSFFDTTGALWAFFVRNVEGCKHAGHLWPSEEASLHWNNMGTVHWCIFNEYYESRGSGHSIYIRNWGISCKTPAEQNFYPPPLPLDTAFLETPVGNAWH